MQLLQGPLMWNRLLRFRPHGLIRLQHSGPLVPFVFKTPALCPSRALVASSPALGTTSLAPAPTPAPDASLTPTNGSLSRREKLLYEKWQKAEKS